VFKRNEEKTAEEQIVTGELRSLLNIPYTIILFARPLKKIQILNSLTCILVPMRALDFSIYLILPASLWPWG
jgi:hypothetical protein